MSQFMPADVPLIGLDATSVAPLDDDLTSWPSDVPLLIIGGDHGYPQWWGTNGLDGMARMYADQGITPYLAINTQDDAGERIGAANRLTWQQVRDLQNSYGIEITNHASQHIQAWNLINTGIRITYAGATATATVAISGTWPAITIASGTAAESFSFDTSNAAYNTLTKLKNAIEAVGSAGTWICRISPELTGNEDSNNLLNCTARTVKVVAAHDTIPANSALFACGGGIVIQYTGTVFKTAYVNITTSSVLEMYGDGTLVGSFNLSNASYDTLSELVAAISAVTGFTAKLMDNDNVTTPSNQTYLTGTEASIRLNWVSGIDVISQPQVFGMGLSISYMIARQLQECTDTAAANGVTIKNFSQPGAQFYPWNVDGAAQVCKSFRGVPFTRSSIAPMMAPCSERPDYFTYNYAVTLSDSIEEMRGWIDALCASPGHYSQWVIHQLSPDGATGYNIGPAYGTASITETNFYTLIKYIKSKVDAGLLRTLTPEQARIALKSTPIPLNRLQNATFQNFGGTLTGFTSVDGGNAIGGWALTTPASITACSISSGTLTLTSNANTLVDVLKQDQIFIPGKTYELSLDLEMPTYTSGNGFYFRVNKRLTSMIKTMQPHTSNTVFTSHKYIRGGRVVLRFTVPKRDDFGRCYVRSSTKGPWDLSAVANAAMKINLGAKGSIDNISVVGAIPATTHANEIATLLNAAIAANASYAELQEYWTVFSAEDGYLIGQLPWRFGDSTGNISMDAATTNGGATAVVMGNATVRGVNYHAQFPASEDYHFYVLITMDMTGTVRIRNPMLREVQWS